MNRFDKTAAGLLKSVLYLFLIFGITFPSLIFFLGLPIIDGISMPAKICIALLLVVVNVSLWRNIKTLTEFTPNKKRDEVYSKNILKIAARILFKI